MAWHAGLSEFNGRDKCNEYSIGIELEGSNNQPFTEQQYQSLASLTKEIMAIYPDITLDRIAGHNDIAPSRKIDPGQYLIGNII
ncbi:N-acetyl-anhydromuranmyl-L-alanine amidase [Actinobacillus equuli]|nr:N-acetyl-anhydromuranmyl-L-alanine amidase [Actinobacillus equuli]